MSFEDADFAETCRQERELRKRHGAVRAKRIGQRLATLRAAQTLADMRDLPGRCHELHGNLARHLTLDLDHPYRLLFRPTGDLGAGAGDGLDWTTVTAITVIGVVDTHD